MKIEKYNVYGLKILDDGELTEKLVGEVFETNAGRAEQEARDKFRDAKFDDLVVRRAGE